MTKLKNKLFPMVMTFLSFLYLIYVYCSEETAMSADTVGGDPGGKVLPFIMGFIVFAGSLYKAIVEKSETKEKDKDTAILFVATLCLTIIYILLNKIVGFVILTVMLVYTNLYLYSTIGEQRKAKQAVCGGVLTLFVTVAVYFVFRFVSKKLLKLGRSGVLPLFKSSSATAVVALLIVTAFLIVFIYAFGKKLKAKGYERVWTASIITFAVVLYLYIVFKQFFAVTLAPGLINY